MINPFTQSVVGKAWLAMLVLAIGFVPAVSAMQQPGDCCDAGAGQTDRACTLNPAGMDAAAVSCCDEQPDGTPSDSDSTPDDSHPCDCSCCAFHTAPSPFAPVNLADPAISLDSVSLLSILAPLRPDSAALVVDTQPPIV